MDIVSWCGVPRYLHNDLPLGNPLGEPGDRKTQLQSIQTALQLASAWQEPGIAVARPPWSGNPDWPSVYGCVTEDNRQALLEMGEENRRKRAENKNRGLGR